MRIRQIFLAVWLHMPISVISTAFTSTPAQPSRLIMYLTGQHDVLPKEPSLLDPLTHVILAFMPSDTFNGPHEPATWPLFTTVQSVRARLPTHTQVMVAIGGWGDSLGFEVGAKDETSRQRWTQSVAQMVKSTGADGVDIDWEYPGGNRDDYKEIPNSERVWEIEAFAALIQSLRAALGPDKLISLAVPGKEADLMAFTPSTIDRLSSSVDFFNIMSYDLMNRRDTVVKHHSGVQDSIEAVQRYLDRGCSRKQVNIGLGYYVKWFLTQDCPQHTASDWSPLGCPTQLLEDPATGADLGKTGQFSWHDTPPSDVLASFSRAKGQGHYFPDGSYGYWDEKEKRWWSYDTAEAVRTKMHRARDEGYGGVFAWGIGEDAPEFERLKATVEGLQMEEARDEL